MPNVITARSIDALISYFPYWLWDYHSDKACTPLDQAYPSSLHIDFAGTEFQVFGTYDKNSGKISCKLGQTSCDKDLLSSNSLDQPFLTIKNPQRQPLTLSLSVPSGNSSFCLSRVTWFDPLASSSPGITSDGIVTPNNGTWARVMKDSYYQTDHESANITFSFQGTGIEVLGMTGQQQGDFRVTLDGQYSVIRSSYSMVDSEATLYRQDGLSYGSHTIVIENIGPRNLTVGQARMFGATDGPTASVSGEIVPTSSDTANAKTVGHHGLTSVGVALVVTVVLASHCIYEKKQVSYDRMCSQCHQVTTGDVHLECVRDNHSVAMNPRPEWEDWNIPDHHNHEVRPISNE
ncbi:transmembrane protein [Ceratobasidium sp. AG-Ba]|nr:transmembrane protein [Ceratobasidium sp. AG-Ba]